MTGCAKCLNISEEQPQGITRLRLEPLFVITNTAHVQVLSSHAQNVARLCYRFQRIHLQFLETCEVFIQDLKGVGA